MDPELLSLLKQNVKDIVQSLKDKGIYGKDTKAEGEWWIAAAQGGETHKFVDRTAPIEHYIGVIFFTKEDGNIEKHFNPPHELNLEHDSSQKKTQGFWVKKTAEKFEEDSHDRTAPEYDFTSVASTNELRSWDARKIAKFLLSESESYDALYACILSQLESVPGDRARQIAEQLRNLMKSTAGAKTSPGKKKKVVETEEGAKSPRRSPSPRRPPSPKAKSPSPKAKPKTPSPRSPKGDLSPGALERREELAKLQKRLAAYNKGLDKPGADKEKITAAIKKLMKDIAAVEEDIETLGFGRISRKSNRRASKTKGKVSRRRSSKKKRLGLLRRTSKGHRKYFEDLKSLKKTRLRRVSRRKVGRVRKASGGRKVSGRKGGRKVRRASRGRKGSKRFGSTIYGLQGGLDSGTVYSGVYPISLNMQETLPNLTH